MHTAAYAHADAWWSGRHPTLPWRRQALCGERRGSACAEVIIDMSRSIEVEHAIESCQTGLDRCSAASTVLPCAQKIPRVRACCTDGAVVASSCPAGLEVEPLFSSWFFTGTCHRLESSGHHALPPAVLCGRPGVRHKACARDGAGRFRRNAIPSFFSGSRGLDVLLCQSESCKSEAFLRTPTANCSRVGDGSRPKPRSGLRELRLVTGHRYPICGLNLTTVASAMVDRATRWQLDAQARRSAAL